MDKKENIFEENKQVRPNIFEKRKYIRSFCNRDFSKNIILADDVYVNIEGNSENYRNTNCIIGKSEEAYNYYINPNINQMNTSYIIKDYDGEILSEYAELFEAKGYIVKAINYMNTRESMKYNLFDYLNYEDDVSDLVKMITKSNIIGLTKGEKLLKNAENLLLEAIIYYIMLELPYEEHNIGTIIKMLDLAKPKGNASEEYASDMNLLFVALEKDTSNEDSKMAVESYKKFLEAARHMEGIIVDNLKKYLSIYSLNSISRITNRDNLELDEIFMAGKKVVLLVVTPSNNIQYEYIADTFISQIITHIKYMADKRHCSKLPNKIHLISNNIIYSDIKNILQEAYKYNMYISLCIDNFSKMMNYYENVYEIIDSCSALICYDYKNEYIKDFIRYKIVEGVNLDSYSEEEKIDEESFDLDEYMSDVDRECYQTFIQYSRPILCKEYDIEESDNYIISDNRVKKYKMDLLKEEIENQIYRNLIYEIDVNQKSVKYRENVNVDISARQLISDEIYSNIEMKLNKTLIKDV